MVLEPEVGWRELSRVQRRDPLFARWQDLRDAGEVAARQEIRNLAELGKLPQFHRPGGPPGDSLLPLLSNAQVAHFQSQVRRFLWFA